MLARCASCGSKKGDQTVAPVRETSEKIETTEETTTEPVNIETEGINTSADRAEYAVIAEKTFKDYDIDVSVKVDGENNTDITLSSTIIDPNWISGFETSAMFKEIEAKGFKRIYYSDTEGFFVFREF